MGRAKHCSEELRNLIRKLHGEGKTMRVIAEIVGCSLKMVFNSIKRKDLPETRGRKRKTSSFVDRSIKIYCKKHPFASSSEIRKELDLPIACSTVRKRLLEQNLMATISRKTPFLSKKNKRDRLEFAKTHVNWKASKWRNILFSDETKINLFGLDSIRKHVRRPPGKAFNPTYTRKTVKHGGGNIMVWGCFSYNGVGPIYWVKEIMNKEIYLDLLQNIMLPYAEEEMPLRWIYQQDNDPKHTSKIVRQWFESSNITVLKWAGQSPDLNPIEHMWVEVKNKLARNSRAKNKQEVWTEVQRAWYSIPVEKCRNLIDSMPRRCRAVINNKGYTTKY